jgi:hypothetical protein
MPPHTGRTLASPAARYQSLCAAQGASLRAIGHTERNRLRVRRRSAFGPPRASPSPGTKALARPKAKAQRSPIKKGYGRNLVRGDACARLNKSVAGIPRFIKIILVICKPIWPPASLLEYNTSAYFSIKLREGVLARPRDAIFAPPPAWHSTFS